MTDKRKDLLAPAPKGPAPSRSRPGTLGRGNDEPECACGEPLDDNGFCTGGCQPWDDEDFEIDV